MTFSAPVLNIINALIAMQSILSCQIDNRLCCITVITAILGLASAWTYANGVKNCMFFKHQSAVRALESGDSSEITPCTVGQEVVGSNPLHGRIKSSVVRSLFGFMQPIRSASPTLDLKYGSMSFAHWLWSVIAPALGMKTTSDLQDTKTVHTRKSHVRTSPHHTPATTWYMSAMQGTQQQAANSPLIIWARIRQILTLREVEELPISLPDYHRVTD